MTKRLCVSLLSHWRRFHYFYHCQSFVTSHDSLSGSTFCVQSFVLIFYSCKSRVNFTAPSKWITWCSWLVTIAIFLLQLDLVSFLIKVEQVVCNKRYNFWSILSASLYAAIVVWKLPSLFLFKQFFSKHFETSFQFSVAVRTILNDVENQLEKLGSSWNESLGLLVGFIYFANICIITWTLFYWLVNFIQFEVQSFILCCWTCISQHLKVIDALNIEFYIFCDSLIKSFIVYILVSMQKMLPIECN